MSHVRSSGAAQAARLRFVKHRCRQIRCHFPRVLMVNMNSPHVSLDTAPPARSMGSVLYAVTALALIVAIGGLGLAYGARAWLDSAAGTPAEPALAVTHIVTIGAQPYVLPAALLADPLQRRDGFAERIDL